MSYYVESFEQFFPEEIWSALWDYFSKRAAFRYGWHSDKKVSEFTHWHIDFLNKSSANQSNEEAVLYGQPEFSAVAAAWDFLKTNHLRGHALVRCYANAHTYGVEGYVHADTHAEGNYTTLVYVVPAWKSEWAGETVFMNDLGEISRSILPRSNRCVIFDGQQLHAARSVSRICPGVRITLMFKTKAPSILAMESR